MITERRFLTGFRSADADTPGLVQEDDGTVWLVAPDGTRTQISGGGSIPSQWTIGVVDDPAQVGEGGLKINLGTDGYAFYAESPSESVFVVDLQAASPKFSFSSFRGAEIRGEKDGSLYLYGPDDPAHGYVEFTLYGAAAALDNKLPRVDMNANQGGTRFQTFDDAGDLAFKVDADGTVHIKTGTTVQADL